ncbi:amino acid deaminase/aldolase [Cohnella thailandensis]|uniref:Amino acid deaminase/aldolase n=1 Tax=Cohnella thailandensis TaxID=557557 RepID=A0A841SV96_9BACL|nr:amino acid deaminase/aldolase [Cohnella thailandensis]MBB6635182.1 amino acid deaminase/aldolase [Cohnella thailandensis]MBP1974352.1 D-serine deaminase-like pyridoxal phosphate-dependent protein [Cohnella thailandensis]
MSVPEYSYYKRVFEGLPTPYAYLDLDLFDANARAIAEAAGDKKVRIASKSIRCVDALRRILSAGSVFQGIMCFTGREAVWLAGQGFDDLLLGYPIWNRDEIEGIARLVHEGHSIVLMVDSMEHVEHIERIAQAAGVRMPVCLDIDMSSTYPGLRFGVWRSPLGGWRQARPIVERIAASKSVRLDGIMGYEAQIAGLGDNIPGQALQNRIVRLLKKRSIVEVARRRSEVLEGIRSLGLPLRIVNAGGTGSLASSRLEPGVTEITAGSGFYSPLLFDAYRGFRYEPAAGFAVAVVRRPAPGVYTCLGGGYVASGAPGNEKLPKPYLPAGMRLMPREGAGEVQTPLRYDGAEPLAIGDPVFFRHAKAGELCERFDLLYAVSNGTIVGEYKTYRGMGECFL